MNLEQQVAQLFMVGFSGHTPNPVTEQFLQAGVGGIIFFRDNFQGLEARTVARLLTSIRYSIPDFLPTPFLSIDQEGGQVERLPHTLFPSLITPRAVALAQTEDPGQFAQHVYETLAQGLKRLGFTMNFFPTLDVNLEPNNPIIGVRSFGDDPQQVWTLAAIAMNAHLGQGIIPVGKHFPGHGNGTVDSHLALPLLHFTPEELYPFQQAIEAGIPAMLVAHGYYPALQQGVEDETLPSSASPTIIQGLLRERCGFQGVVITDDLCMGAITQTRDPLEAALLSLEAGVDILLYKQSTPQEWAVYEGVLAAVASGRISAERIAQSVGRIVALKNRFPWVEPNYKEIMQSFQPEQVAAQSEALAAQAISILSQEGPSPLPLLPQQSVWLFHPNRAGIVNYAFDQPTSLELPQLLASEGLTRLIEVSYWLKEEIPLPLSQPDPEIMVFVTFNPHLYPAQVVLYGQLRAAYPTVPLVIVSAGMPTLKALMPEVSLSLGLCSYRPPTLKALARFLTHSSVLEESFMIFVTSVRYLEQYQLLVTFNDGMTKWVDLAHELAEGIFEPLRDLSLFQQVRIDPDSETLVWPNGADMAPEHLYQIGHRVPAHFRGFI